MRLAARGLRRWGRVVRGFITRRDAIEPAIVAALEAVGAYVVRLSQVGVPDLLVSYRGALHLLEVIAPEKGAKYRATGGLTPAQVRWHARWTAAGLAPVPRVRSAEEALEMIGANGRRGGLERIIPEPGEFQRIYAELDRKRKRS